MSAAPMMIDEIDSAFNMPVESSTLARWERKALQPKDMSRKTPGRRAAGRSGRSKSKTPGRTPGREYPGRFIPNRDAMNPTFQLHSVTNENACPDMLNGSNRQVEFNNKLAQGLFQGDDLNSRILAFKNKAPKPSTSHHNNLRVLYTQNKAASYTKRVQRHISSSPERILDAPDLLDDYYLNLLDWSASNTLAVALGSAVYLWDASTGSIEMLCESADEADLITSVSWMGDGSHLAVGTTFKDVQLWNVERKKQVRSMNGHAARVGSLAWNNHILSSGSRDSTIIHHDVRIAEHQVGTLRGHEQEICGLKWSLDGTQLASGGNDNLCMIWDANSTHARFKFTDSLAAVKALAWCPFEKNLIATGGGTADRHIRFYDTLTGTCVNKIDTGSQVCSLLWSKHEKELLSAHGFSQNQLTVWKYPTMVKVAELTGHTSRVLHTALSADGETVCSAAADETLRFWKVWDTKKRTKTITRRGGPRASTSNMMRNIR